MSSAHSTNTVRFDAHRIPTPVNAPPATYIPLDIREAFDLWSHAVLLFHSYEWEQAVTGHRRLIKRCENILPLARLWFNVGVIRCHLGEYFLASEAFIKTVKIRKDLAIGWYCLGAAVFQLEDFRKAKRAFQRCLGLFEEGITSMDYRSMGLEFVLEKIRVEWNVRQTFFEKNHKQMKAPLPLDTHLSLNRLPAGKIFEPTRGFISSTGFEDGGNLALSSSISSLTSSTPSSGSPNSLNTVKRARNLLRRKSARRLAFGQSAAHSTERSAASSLPAVVPLAGSSIGSKNSQIETKHLRSAASLAEKDKPLPMLPFVSPEALKSLHKRMNVQSSLQQARAALPSLLIKSAGKSTTTYTNETASRSSVSLNRDQDDPVGSLALRSVESLLEPTNARPNSTRGSSSSSYISDTSAPRPPLLSRTGSTYSSTVGTHTARNLLQSSSASDYWRGEVHTGQSARPSPIPPRSSYAAHIAQQSSIQPLQRYGTLELEDTLTPRPLFSSPNSRSSSKTRDLSNPASLKKATVPDGSYPPRSSSLPRKPLPSNSLLQTLTSARYDPNAPGHATTRQLPKLSSARYDPNAPGHATTQQLPALTQARYNPATHRQATQDQPPQLSSAHYDAQSLAPQLSTLSSARYDPSAPSQASELPMLSSARYEAYPRPKPPTSQLPTISSERYDANAPASHCLDPYEFDVEDYPERIDSYAIFGLGREAAQAALQEQDTEDRLRTTQKGREGKIRKARR